VVVSAAVPTRRPAAAGKALRSALDAVPLRL
jgi:hypothetical protein